MPDASEPSNFLNKWTYVHYYGRMARPNNDKTHLRRLRDLYAREGCLPSYGQIAVALGFQARNAAYKLTQRLIASEHLVKASGGRLAPGRWERAQCTVRRLQAQVTM